MKAPNIRHVTYVSVPADRVYKTLTTGTGWDAWFTRGTRIDPRPGGEIFLKWVDFGARRYTVEDEGVVIDAEAGKKFTFRWCPASHPTTVYISLDQVDGGTLITLSETGYEASSRDLETLVECAAGWGEALTLLKFYLEHGLTYGNVPQWAQATNEASLGPPDQGAAP